MQQTDSTHGKYAGVITRGDGEVTSIDGIRVDFANSWGLIRASNTTPVLVLRFEADSEDELIRVQDLFRSQLLSIAPDLQPTF